MNLSDLLAMLGGANRGKLAETVMFQVRVPRTLVAVMAGAGLSVAGMFMQTLFRNPLAGPSVLGISGGSSLGVAFLILLGGGASLTFFWGVVGAAFAGALVVLLLVLFAASHIRGNTTVLLLGIMLGFFISSVITILQYYSSADQLRSFTLWGMGSFGALLPGQLGWFSIVFLVAWLGGWFRLRALNARLLGEDYAKSMGVNIATDRFWLIALTGLSVALITAFCGPVAFIGLAVPHLARLVVRSQNHFKLYPLCSLIGAIVALLADILTRIPGGGTELPLNAILSLLGAPVVAYVLIRKPAFAQWE